MPVIADWDDAYVNAAHIAGGGDFPARWSIDAARFRAGLSADRRREAMPYGRHDRQRVDLFLPEGAARGMVVLVHGGYWRAFDRDLWSHLAAGPVARGWIVAIPGYPLAPEVRIAEISRSIGDAVTQLAAAIPGPIVLTGHSAGGHLVTRQVCGDSRLPERVAARITRVVPISGVFDLRPLLRLAMNADLRLDEAEAAAESPALLAPRPGVIVHAWVGADERPEFLRQSALIANIWTGMRADTSLTVETGRHHFDVIAGLSDPDSALVSALID